MLWTGDLDDVEDAVRAVREDTLAVLLEPRKHGSAWSSADRTVLL